MDKTLKDVLLVFAFGLTAAIFTFIGGIVGKADLRKELKKDEQRFRVVNDLHWLGYNEKANTLQQLREIEIKDTKTGYSYKFEFWDKEAEVIKFKEVK
jgi:hypothetical protein